MKDRIVKMLEDRQDTADAWVRIGATCLVVGILATCMSILGMMEKKDNDNAVKEYCKGVHEKVFPDYNGSYQRQCLNGEPKQ